MEAQGASARVPVEPLPLFPLPSTVLLPGQRLPLHIFEPRYLQMVRDALEGIPYIVVALIEPPLTEPARFSRVATAGRIVSYQRLSNGRFNILVEGAVRALLQEVPSDRLYRKVRCTPLPEPLGVKGQVPTAERAALLSMASLLLRALRARSPVVAFEPPPDLETGRLAWRVADKLVADPLRRQAILEASSVRERVALTTVALADVLGQIGGLPPSRGGVRAS